jgi:Fe-S-cluster containining protein
MPEDFGRILDALAETAPGRELTPIADAVTALRELLPLADNLGESGDDRDAFVLLDRLTTAVRETYAGGHCKAGCSGCCDSQTAIFDVSPGEWAAIEREVARWSAERREAFKERFKREHGLQLRAYRWLGYLKFFEPLADRYFARNPYRCPFLENGRCSIYAARPLACRMYGFFAIRARFYERPSVYGCGLQTSYYEQQPRLTLPAVNMVAAQARKLTRGRARILPMWIAQRL